MGTYEEERGEGRVIAKEDQDARYDWDCILKADACTERSPDHHVMSCHAVVEG